MDGDEIKGLKLLGEAKSEIADLKEQNGVLQEQNGVLQEEKEVLQRKLATIRVEVTREGEE